MVATGYVYHNVMPVRRVELAGYNTSLISDHCFNPENLRPDRMPIKFARRAIEHWDLLER